MNITRLMFPGIGVFALMAACQVFGVPLHVSLPLGLALLVLQTVISNPGKNKNWKIYDWMVYGVITFLLWILPITLAGLGAGKLIVHAIARFA